MGFLFGWEEVYVSCNYKDFIRCRDILDENNIKYRTNVQSNVARLGINNMIVNKNMSVSKGLMISRGGPDIEGFYTIYAKKADAEKVKYLLRIKYQ